MTKVLLVEDDNNLREIYEARLQAEGYSIVSAHDGEEALVVAKAEKPDLIISDIMMPKISGFEMLDILRNTEGLQDVKVIMLTALGQADDQQRAGKLGADRYLVKSQVTLEDIVRVAHELLADGNTPPPVGSSSPEPAPDSQPPESSPVAGNDGSPTSNDTASAEAEIAKDSVATASEQAQVNDQIQSFVIATDSAEPVTPSPAAPEPTPAPEPSPTPVPEPVTPIPPADPVPAPAPAPEPQTSTSTDTSAVDPDSPADADDQLVADAVDKLESGAEETEKDSVEPEDMPSSKTVGGERVIQPISAPEPAKDIQALVAAEEAKEASAAGSAPVIPGAIIVDDQQGPVQPAPVSPAPAVAPEPALGQPLTTESPAISAAKANDGSASRPEGQPVDPNSIAL